MTHSVTIYTNKLTSEHDPFPKDYRSFNSFCQTPAATTTTTTPAMNLGEWLEGDRIAPSPYTLEFGTNMYFQHLCVQNLGNTGNDKQQLEKAIREKYHHNWILDNLPLASKSEVDVYITTVFSQGFPVGFMGDDNKVYVHNHVNIEVIYHEQDHGMYRIVQFIVEPFSIQHQLSDDNGQTSIVNPIDSCNSNAEQKQNTNYDMLQRQNMQPVSGQVLYTYDVIWKEDPSLDWRDRWDAYLNTKNKAACHF